MEQNLNYGDTLCRATSLSFPLVQKLHLLWSGCKQTTLDVFSMNIQTIGTVKVSLVLQGTCALDTAWLMLYSMCLFGQPCRQLWKLSVFETCSSGSNKDQDLDPARHLDYLHCYSLHLSASVTLICLFRWVWLTVLHISASGPGYSCKVNGKPWCSCR